MKLNKEKIDLLLKKDDALLWQEIINMAQKFGYTLPEKAPSAQNMEKIRTAIENADKLSALDVAKLLSAFRAKRNKE